MSKDLKILCKDPALELSCYRDHQFSGRKFQQEKLLKESSTLNMGNLSFYTTEEKIHELFSRSDIRNIFMGLDKIKKTACGFCFVECHNRADAENAMRFLTGTCLDEWIIRTDWDVGFREGQQYGRGKSGGQVRDVS
ncbi:NCBP2L isoform 2 [Pan troglodytes]|uniref:Nuclear cap-binding protein subunit 2 n=1 Tax=Pan troglodytes TaxID=9598 RepID=A0A2J8J2K2_PANTR|nr:nuclear cap-binding protein subunit 2-like [Pan paniscus]PNI17007.1 NCBP2L isoform 2 [Pan troglodytes]